MSIDRPFYEKAKHFLEWRKNKEDSDIQETHQHFDSVSFEEDDEDITTLLRIVQNG